MITPLVVLARTNANTVASSISVHSAVSAPAIANSFTYPIASSNVRLKLGYGVQNSSLVGLNGCYWNAQTKKYVLFSKLWHAGEDWFAYTSAATTSIYAVANGIVKYVSPLSYSYPGGVIIIQHTLPDNTLVYSMYGHLNPNKMIVKVNQTVTKGQVIATGLVPQKSEGGDNTHLHWEIRYFFDGSGITKGPGYTNSCSAQPGPGYTWPGKPDNFVFMGQTYRWTNPSQFISTHMQVGLSPVNTTEDLASPCTAAAYSFRCAIIQANADGQGDTITFNIPSSDPGCKLTTIHGNQVSVCTITPTSGLPQMTASNTIINGYSQPGAQPNNLPLGSGDNAILTLRIDGSTGAGGFVLTGSASHDIIKGLEITGFNPYGLLLYPSSVTNNTISGNFIGTDGITALGNGAGIYIASGASSNIIGGSTPDTANLISGNSGQGIVVGAGTANSIQGNYIGTDSTGMVATRKQNTHPIKPPLSSSGLANGTGIAVFAAASSNMIGGTTTSAGNIIAHNSYGITTDGSSTTNIVNNTINSNFIGIQARNGESGDIINQNTISNNSDAGVLVGNSSNDSTHISIQGNSIFSNGGLGIDLYPADTVNCTGPTTGAPDDYTPCPVIKTATTTTVSGTACPACSVEIFVATNEGDDQGHGEGKILINSTSADNGGNWSISGTLSVGEEVTAIATTPSSSGYAETSEFAANVIVMPPPKTWHIISSPTIGAGGSLSAITTISPTDIWAVGSYNPTIDTSSQTLTEHWNGTKWSIVSSPNISSTNYLRGVAAVSSNDVWAVGGTYEGSAGPPTLIEHWNGSSWTTIPGPSPSSIGLNDLNAVAAVASNDAWAVGVYQDDSSGNYVPLIEHWNGTSWSVFSPNTVGELKSIAVVSANDIWAVGDSGGSTFTEHWNGSSWSFIPSPNSGSDGNYLTGLTALASNNVWAVGDYYDSRIIHETLVEHWDGSSWSIVSSPNSGTDQNYLNGVAANLPGNIWAVGSYTNDNVNADEALIENGNGTSWNIATSPVVTFSYLNAVAIDSVGNVWGAGYYFDNSTGYYQGFIEEYS